MIAEVVCLVVVDAFVVVVFEDVDFIVEVIKIVFVGLLVEVTVDIAEEEDVGSSLLPITTSA